MDCDLCDRPATLSTGRDVYPHRSDLYSKRFWTCHPCKARVGCHPGTVNPLGGMANEELRGWRSNAHAAFDPLWKDGHLARPVAYLWLADALNIPLDDCHIGQMDVDQCKQVIKSVASSRRSYARNTQ